MSSFVAYAASALWRKENALRWAGHIFSNSIWAAEANNAKERLQLTKNTDDRVKFCVPWFNNVIARQNKCYYVKQAPVRFSEHKMIVLERCEWRNLSKTNAGVSPYKF